MAGISYGGCVKICTFILYETREHHYYRMDICTYFTFILYERKTWILPYGIKYVFCIIRDFYTVVKG